MILVVNHHCVVNLDHIQRMEVVQEGQGYSIRLTDSLGKAESIATSGSEQPLFTLFNDIHAHWGRGDGLYDLYRRADHLGVAKQVEHGV